MDSAACCSFDDRYIYSIGGNNNDRKTNAIFVYDTRNNTWSEVNVDSDISREIAPDTCMNAI